MVKTITEAVRSADYGEPYPVPFPPDPRAVADASEKERSSVIDARR
jgi:hypothetical protein